MGEKKYRAFISYSHADEAWGEWLQKSLERFRAPAAMLKAGAPARLAPVFRDREDLPAAGNLNSAIQAALGDSEFLIVICSPKSAQSRWVNEEIKLFHKLHGAGRTFALVVDGLPGAGAGRESEECFPAALKFKLDADGQPTAEPAEPLAADAREAADGKRHALLKVAAGILGVGLDDLVRRDAQRRARQAWTVAGAASTLAAGAALLSAYAIAKGEEAKRMRGKAEDLIEFMLTDLTGKLEPVGKLDILESVGDKALAYYKDQDLKSLEPAALARRARAMTQLGTIHQRRGDYDAALAAFRAAEAVTSEALRRAPNDPDRIFDHAQNVFYVGDVLNQLGDVVESEKRMFEYLRYAERLVAIDGQNPKWRLELAYATSNIGASKSRQGELSGAISYFTRSAEARKELAASDPANQQLALAHAYAVSWAAYTYLDLGDFEAARNNLLTQLRIYEDAPQSVEENFAVQGDRLVALRRLLEAEIALGAPERAAQAGEEARALAGKLLSRDKEQSDWMINAVLVPIQLSNLASSRADSATALGLAQEAVNLSEMLIGKGKGDLNFVSPIGFALIRLYEAGDANAAIKLREFVRDNDDSRAHCNAYVTLAREARRLRRKSEYEEMIGRAAPFCTPKPKNEVFVAKINHAAFLVEKGAIAEARPPIAALEAAAPNHPRIKTLSAAAISPQSAGPSE